MVIGYLQCNRFKACKLKEVKKEFLQVTSRMVQRSEVVEVEDDIIRRKESEAYVTIQKKDTHNIHRLSHAFIKAIALIHAC